MSGYSNIDTVSIPQISIKISNERYIVEDKSVKKPSALGNAAGVEIKLLSVSYSLVPSDIIFSFLILHRIIVKSVTMH